MPFLTPEMDRYLVLAMVLTLLAAVAFLAIRKYISKKKTPVVVEETPAPVVEKPAAPVAPGSAGGVKIYDVPPKTAAMLMCIVADKLQKPLNELRFISIKEVK